MPAQCRALIGVLLVGLFQLFAPGGQAAEGDPHPVPSLQHRVTDLTATLSKAEEASIEARLGEFEKRKGSQIAVLIVPTTQPESIFDYSLRVAESWKLGRKGVDDGVLFVVAKNDRKMQILTGPGLSGSGQTKLTMFHGDLAHAVEQFGFVMHRHDGLVGSRQEGSVNVVEAAHLHVVCAHRLGHDGVEARPSWETSSSPP